MFVRKAINVLSVCYGNTISHFSSGVFDRRLIIIELLSRDIIIVLCFYCVCKGNYYFEKNK